jgi:hypothetical protein
LPTRKLVRIRGEHPLNVRQTHFCEHLLRVGASFVYAYAGEAHAICEPTVNTGFSDEDGS